MVVAYFKILKSYVETVKDGKILIRGIADLRIKIQAWDLGV